MFPGLLTLDGVAVKRNGSYNRTGRSRSLGPPTSSASSSSMSISKSFALSQQPQTQQMQTQQTQQQKQQMALRRSASDPLSSSTSSSVSSSNQATTRDGSSEEEDPEEAALKRRAALVPYSPWLRLLRFTLGWLFNILLFVMIALVNLVYGATFGAPAFKVIMLSWFLALGQTFLVRRWLS